MGEKERSVKDESYYAIFGWMTNPKKMNLSGLELQLFAIIFGFCQSQPLNGYFASTNYLAEFTGATPRGVRKALDGLIDKGYIIRVEQEQYHTYKYIAMVPDFDEAEKHQKNAENNSEQNSEREGNNVPNEELSSVSEELSSQGQELSSQHEELSSADGEHSSTNNILNNINISNNKTNKKRRQSAFSLADCPHVDLSFSEIYYLTRYYGTEITKKYLERFEKHLVKSGKHYDWHLDVIEKWILDDNPTLRGST